MLAAAGCWRRRERRGARCESFAYAIFCVLARNEVSRRSSFLARRGAAAAGSQVTDLGGAARPNRAKKRREREAQRRRPGKSWLLSDKEFLMIARLHTSAPLVVGWLPPGVRALPRVPFPASALAEASWPIINCF